MSELETMREQEAECIEVDYYDAMVQKWNARAERAETRKVVIRDSDRPWEQTKQGLLKHFLHPDMKDTALQDWLFFMQTIKTHSGRHRHQGGLAIYVIEGQGYTTVNGQRVDWEEGDLVLLPVQPNGVEHQHFNLDPEKPSRWLAMIPVYVQDLIAGQIKQVDLSPDWEAKEKLGESNL